MKGTSINEYSGRPGHMARLASSRERHTKMKGTSIKNHPGLAGLIPGPARPVRSFRRAERAGFCDPKGSVSL